MAHTATDLLPGEQDQRDPRELGYEDGAAGLEPNPPSWYVRAERSLYFRGHISGSMDRLRLTRPSA